MTKKFGVTASGGNFSVGTINDVWEKGTPVAGQDPKKVRKDKCGALIRREDYGKLVPTGWQVDHKLPLALDGTDDLSNLQPLQWENNLHKSDDWPSWTCKVRAR
jgi:hypothetical protein